MCAWIRTKLRPDRLRAGTGRRERGQSLVETAIVLPVLLLLLAAVIDFGRAFDVYIVLTNAVREGARFGSVKPDLTVDQVKDIVIDDVLGTGTNLTRITEVEFDADNVTVEGQTEDSDVVKVTATYTFDLWFGGLIGVPQVTLYKEASMPRWRNK